MTRSSAGQHAAGDHLRGGTSPPAAPGVGADLLLDSIAVTHDRLARGLTEAASCHPTPERPRALFSAADPLLAAASRHVAAANTVLSTAARQHLSHGHARSRDLARQSRSLEAALCQVKAKLYGSTFAVRRPWSRIWAEVDAELAAFARVEERLVADLVQVCDSATCLHLAERIYRAERRVPTRPHPYLPHRGASGRLARVLARRVDAFWDTAEGRMIPEPPPPQRPRPGRFTQYLLADPYPNNEESSA